MSARTRSAKSHPLEEGKRTWIEIDRKAALHNYRTFRRIIGREVRLWPVVKSNAYGHGIFLFSKLLDSFGADGFCVDSPIEGLNLRRAGVKKPILVLGPTLPVLLEESFRKKITLTISTGEGLELLSRLRRVPEFHLKIDTGMHRQGIYPEEFRRILEFIDSSPKLRQAWRGMYSHFAATDPGMRKSAETQFEKFLETKMEAESRGYGHLFFHISNTGGTLLDPRYHLDAVRIGIGLYGFAPSQEAGKASSVKLRPVLSWRTVVTETKKLSSGDRIGYDLTEGVSRPSTLGILPVGYWHGLARSLSGQGTVLVRKTEAKILGRVSMDLIAIDLTDSCGRVGDVATLIGRDGPREIRADSLAAMSGTIHYEFLTRLNPLIERILI